MSVSVIIPAWNLWELTRDCLHSLAEHTPPALDVEVLVVDNGSTDATREALAPTLTALFGPRGKAIVLPENQGFARACNAGAQAATGSLLFFLNNDTLLHSHWLPPLLHALESPFVGMAGPLLLLPESGHVQHCGIVFAPTLEVSHLYALFPGSHPLVRKSRMLQALTGAAMLLPARLFQRCGGFHQGYVNGFEDMDLCCAVRREGLHLMCAPQSVITHLTSQTPGRFDHDGPNGQLLNRRWPGGFSPDLHRFGLEDGYALALTPVMELYLALPAAKELALTTAFSQQWNEERCRARLEAEPLWQGGYALLAAHLEQHNRWHEACAVRSRMTHFFPLPEHFAALAKAAARVHTPQSDTVAAQAGQAARDMLTLAGDREALRKKTDALTRWGESVGDVDMVALFKNFGGGKGNFYW